MQLFFSSCLGVSAKLGDPLMKHSKMDLDEVTRRTRPALPLVSTGSAPLTQLSSDLAVRFRGFCALLWCVFFFSFVVELKNI